MLFKGLVRFDPDSTIALASQAINTLPLKPREFHPRLNHMGENRKVI